MDTQTLTPSSSGPFSSGTPSSGGGGGGRSPLLIMLVVLLGIGTLIFGVLTVTFSSKATKAAKLAAAQSVAAAATARDQQKKDDDIAAIKDGESPYRTYVAPQQFGSFRINFPKTWSSWVDQEPTGTQVHLVLNPDFIRKTGGADEPMAIRVQLLERPKDQFLAQYSGQIKSKKIQQAAITVSNQPSFDLTGQFPDRKTVREVVVPVRDKVIVFTTEDAKFASEFTEILSQAKIIP